MTPLYRSRLIEKIGHFKRCISSVDFDAIHDFDDTPEVPKVASDLAASLQRLSFCLSTIELNLITNNGEPAVDMLMANNCFSDARRLSTKLAKLTNSKEVL